MRLSCLQIPVMAACAVAWLAAASPIPSAASDLSATQILRQVDDMWRGESSRADMAMEVVTENWKRTLELRAWSLGTERSLVVITSPAKERGVATLKVDRDIWNYLPRVNRVIRVPSSMMMAGWMGSHFTNDDLVKESRMSEDYDASIAFLGVRDGREVYDLVLVPRPDAAVVWGRIEITVLKDGLIPLRSLYFDEDGALVRTMTFSDVGVLAGRKVPRLFVLVPEDKPDERTTVRYRTLDIGIGLEKGFFSLDTLSRRDLAQ